MTLKENKYQLTQLSVVFYPSDIFPGMNFGMSRIDSSGRVKTAASIATIDREDVFPAFAVSADYPFGDLDL